VSTGWILLILAGVILVPQSLKYVLGRFGSQLAGPVGLATPIIVRFWAAVVFALVAFA
jgi:hypothetical protein